MVMLQIGLNGKQTDITNALKYSFFNAMHCNYSLNRFKMMILFCFKTLLLTTICIYCFVASEIPNFFAKSKSKAIVHLPFRRLKALFYITYTFKFNREAECLEFDQGISQYVK